METVNELLEKVTQNYQELETAMADKVEMSRKVINQWHRETRELVARLSDLKPQPQLA